LKAGEEASRLDLKCRANLFRLPPCRSYPAWSDKHPPPFLPGRAAMYTPVRGHVKERRGKRPSTDHTNQFHLCVFGGWPV